MFDEAMKILDAHLTCKVCGRIHEAQEATKIAEVWRTEMDSADVEEIEEDMVERWQDKFEEIEKAFAEEVVLGECGDAAAETGSVPAVL